MKREVKLRLFWVILMVKEANQYTRFDHGMIEWNAHIEAFEAM